MKQADLRNIFRKASKIICKSTIVVSPDPLSPTPSTSSAIKTPENIEENLDDFEPAAEGDTKWNTPLISCRLHFKCDGTHAETRFHLSEKRTSPFKSVEGGGQFS